MRIGAKTDRGPVRGNNEDRIYIDEENSFFILADGMGGAQGGEIASEMAVEIISMSLKEHIKEVCDIPMLMKESIAAANEYIYNASRRDSTLDGMGTTVIVVIYSDGRYYLSHIGDSRAYLIRDREMTQLTQDHSLVMQLVLSGEISMEEARSHHLRHIITEVMGSKEKVDVDVISISAEKGDKLLLCTDGLTDMVMDEEIRDIVFQNDEMNVLCENLVSAAIEKGGMDNISVILVLNN